MPRPRSSSSKWRETTTGIWESFSLETSK
jgi:hypothetical protein